MKYIENNKCFLCGETSFNMIHKGVRGSNEINVIKCTHCGLVQLDKFIADLNAFYEESNMRPVSKTIKEIRNAAFDDDYRRFKFTRNMIENKSVLDFGAGGGGYACIANKTAESVFAIELEKNMQEAIKSDGIPCFSSVDELIKSHPQKRFDCITMFHVLEHLQNPITVLKNLSDLLTENGRIIVEVPNADDALLSLYECEAFANFTYWMCHLYLYTNNTLSLLIEKAGLKLQVLEQIQRYPLANHLHWLSMKRPGGHQKWTSLCDVILDKNYGDKLARLGIADTIMVIIEKKS